MKNIQSWEKFNESNELLNEGLVIDIIKLPFKVLGFVLKPITSLIARMIVKKISIEFMFKNVEKILQTKSVLSLEINNIKKQIESGKGRLGNLLTPNEKRELESKVKKFNEKYPKGFNFNEEKKKMVTYFQVQLKKEKDTKRIEDLEWILKKMEGIKPKEGYGINQRELENIISKIE
jgi:hypothetical protein